MLIYSLIFEVIKLNQDLINDICPRAQRIKSKTYSIWSDDSERGYNVEDWTFPQNSKQNCTYPKPFPYKLEQDLIEQLNDIRYLHGMGNWPVVLSGLELHSKIVTEGIWFWYYNTNSTLVSDHVTQAGAKCTKELPWGSTGFAYSSVGGSAGNYKAGKMLWDLIDESLAGMGHRAAMFSPALYQTRFCLGRNYIPPTSDNYYFPGLYFGVLSAYYRTDDEKYSTLKWNNPNMPRPDWIALPPPGYVDYTMVPKVWTFQSPKIDRKNVTYRAYINGTLLVPDPRYDNGGYQDLGDWSTTDGARFTRQVGFDTAWRNEARTYKPFPYPGTKIRVEVESNGYSWEYETLVVDCDKVPKPATPAVSPIETPAISPVETPAVSPIETPAVSPVETPARSPIETPAVSPVETPAMSPVETSTPTPSQSPQSGNSKNNLLSGEKDNQKSRSKAIGLGVGITVAIIVCAAIGVGIFILVSKGIIGRAPPTPSDEEGIDV